MRLLLFALFLAMICSGCKKNDPTMHVTWVDGGTPSNPDTTVISGPTNGNNPTKLSPLDSINLSITLSEQCGAIADNAISQLTGDFSNLDANGIVSSVAKIKGVKSVSLDNSKTSLYIQRNDNAYFSVPLYDWSSQHFIYSSVNQLGSSTKLNLNSAIPNIPSTPHISPKSKKAIILSPFTSSLQATGHIQLLKQLLIGAGYEVVCPEPNQITINTFNGDYLSGFGVIYILTHGRVSLISGKQVTELNTGLKYDASLALTSAYKNTDKFTLVENRHIHYFAVTTDYLKRTLSKKFPNSIVYVNGCGSLEQTDLANFFISNGAQVISGNTSVIDRLIAISNASELFTSLVSGNEFSYSLYFTKNLQGIGSNQKIIANDHYLYNSLDAYAANSSKTYLVDNVSMIGFISKGFGMGNDALTFTANLSKQIGNTDSKVYVTNNINKTSFEMILSQISINGHSLEDDLPFTQFMNPNLPSVKDITPVIFTFTAKGKSGNTLTQTYVPYTLLPK